jgi:serine/threonine-protein phosphatase PPG1
MGPIPVGVTSNTFSVGFDVDKCIQKAMNAELLDETTIKLVCLKVRELLLKEENVKLVNSPVTVVGDVHG